MRVVLLAWLRAGAGAEGAARFERALATLPERIAAVTCSRAGRHLPGSLGGGDLTGDLRLDSGDLAALQADSELAGCLSPGGPVERLDAVALRPLAAAAPEPELRDGIKRTLLLRVRPGADPLQVERFERELAEMPRHIESIRNWSLARADPSLPPGRWTHAWEQEFHDVAGLEADYMGHPYHWARVDAWFDPESPQWLVDVELAHVYCPAPTSVLAAG